MATSKFLRTFRTTTGAPITAATIWLVPQSDTYPTNALALTAHATRDGQYYRDNVPDGEYKVYIDPAGGSSPTLYDEHIWLGEQRVTTISDHFDSADSYKLKTSGIQDKFPIVNSNGEAHGGTTAKVSYIHPRGLAEYIGDSAYGGEGIYGLGYRHLFTANETVKKIKFQLYKVTANITINVGVYKYSSGGLWAGGASSGLDLIETFSGIEAQVPLLAFSNFIELTLTSNTLFLANECLVVLIEYSGTGTNIVQPKWAADTYGDRVAGFYNTTTNPLDNGTWITGYLLTPLILESDKVDSDDLVNIQAELDLKAEIDPADGSIHGGIISEYAYIHSRGLSEYDGDGVYGNSAVYGLGLQYLFDRLEVVKSVRFRLHRVGTAGADVRVYRKSTAGVWAGNIADLTLIEEFTGLTLSLESSDFLEVILTDTVFFGVDEAIVVLAKWNDEGGYNYIEINKWSVDTYSDRGGFFYTTNTDPYGNNWIEAYGAPFFGTPLLLGTGAVGQESLTVVNNRLTDLENNSALAFIPRLTIPSKIYAVIGHELNLWYDALLIQFGDDVKINVSSTVGLCKERCWRFTPDTAGDYSVSITVSDRNGTVLDTASITVTVGAANAGSGTKQVIHIGDSLTFSSLITTEFRNLVDTDGGADVTNLGTKGSAPNLHEGIAGATWYTFAENSGYNPFWIGGKLDFQQYMADNGFTGNIDYAQITLGVNESLGSELSQTDVTTIVNQAKALITALLSAGDGYPACKIMIGLPTICGNTKDGFASNYGSSKNKELYERNIRLIWENFVSEFDNPTYNSNVYLMIPGLMIDRHYGYDLSNENVSSRVTTVQIASHTNAVHPTNSGYYQIADAYYNIFRNLV